MKIFHILIQARLDSRRLPRKVLKKMDETTVLKCLIDRLKALKVKNKVVILVPNDKKNVYLYNYTYLIYTYHTTSYSIM